MAGGSTEAAALALRQQRANDRINYALYYLALRLGIDGSGDPAEEKCMLAEFAATVLELGIGVTYPGQSGPKQ